METKKNHKGTEEFNWKRNLVVLWCCVFLVCASYTMVIPFLPLFLLKELQLPVSTAKMWSGGIIAITFVVAGVMAPFWGARGDVIGQKKNALRAGIGLGLCYFLSGMVATPLQLLGVRLLTGIISGFVPACMTIASASLPEEKTGWGMGLMQTANFSGSIMGPLLGGLLGAWFGMRMSFYVAAVALLVATAAIYFMVCENKEANAKDVANSVKPKDLLKDLRREFANKTLLYIMGVFAIVKACTMVIQPLLTIYVNELMHGAAEAISISGVILSLAGIAGIIAAPFWGNQGQAYGYAKMLSLAMILAGIANIFQLAVHTIWMFAVVYFIYGLFVAGAAPNLLSYVVQSTEANERGKAFGLTTSADQLGGAIGPLAGGFLGAYLAIDELLALTGLVLIISGIHIYIRKVKISHL